MYSEVECTRLYIFFVDIHSCRVKRIEQRDVLDTDKNLESGDIEAIKSDNQAIRNEINELHSKFDALRKFAAQKKIPLPFDC